jgi:Domain of unknown function (DUF6371)
MKEYSFRLEKYTTGGSRHDCPSCGTRKQFTLYIDGDGNYLDNRVGICNRINNCGYHYTPKQFFNEGGSVNFEPKPFIYEPPKQPSLHTYEEVAASLNLLNLTGETVKTFSFEDRNNFLFGIERIYGLSAAREIRRRFFIGESEAFKSKSVIFWQINELNEVRGGKILQYDPMTLKRKKYIDKETGEKRSLITWQHKHTKKDNFNMVQCLFGLHQLRQAELSQQIAIVESEKTAIVGTIEMPEYVWLACGQLQGLTESKLKPLFGRNVTFFPDCKGFDLWCEKIADIQKKVSFSKCRVSDLLEQYATEQQKEDGADLADFFLSEKTISH